jgi:hypothetical protein
VIRKQSGDKYTSAGKLDCRDAVARTPVNKIASPNERRNDLPSRGMEPNHARKTYIR